MVITTLWHSPGEIEWASLLEAATEYLVHYGLVAAAASIEQIFFFAHFVVCLFVCSASLKVGDFED